MRSRPGWSRRVRLRTLMLVVAAAAQVPFAASMDGRRRFQAPESWHGQLERD